MGKLSRTKGHSFERLVASRLRNAMPGADIKRGLQSRGGGAEVPDVVCPVFHVECKVGARPSVQAALRQATSDAQPGKVPLAVIKVDRCQPYVALGLAEFLEFLSQWWIETGGKGCQSK